MLVITKSRAELFYTALHFHKSSRFKAPPVLKGKLQWIQIGFVKAHYCGTQSMQNKEGTERSPFSVFSCSVSVRVRLELALLDRHELRPDFMFPRPHRRMACSGDTIPSVSVSASEPTLSEQSRCGIAMSERYATMRGATGSPKPRSRREKSAPKKQIHKEASVKCISIYTRFSPLNSQDPSVGPELHSSLSTYCICLSYQFPCCY